MAIPYVDREQAEKERFSILPKGEYWAVITKAEERVSRSGNEMACFELDIMSPDGNSKAKDFITYNSMMWKFIHAADAANLGDKYDDQSLKVFMFEKRKVRVMVDVEEGKEKTPDQLREGEPLGTKWHDKNKIVDYLRQASSPKAQNRSTKPAAKAPPMQEDDEFQDSDVPF